MHDRLLLDKINYEKGTVLINGKSYELKDKVFPTIDPDHPYQLTKEEQALIEKLRFSFLNCDKLQNHVKTLFTKGSTYLAYNSNLLYHGCIPLDDKGQFKELRCMV